MDDMHAIGFSSGAYMMSCMAFLYQGWFRSLSIQMERLLLWWGLCPFPVPGRRSILEDHPLTLFLHKWTTTSCLRTRP